MRPLADLTDTEFKRLSKATRGSVHAERSDNPVWHARIPHNLEAWRGDWEKRNHPEWHFSRHGMSRTLLSDDTIVFIAGEHEDYYDADFFIYNDVIIQRLGEQPEIYCYPTRDFPPTDFHTATLTWGRGYDDRIFIIGGLGYQADRIPGTTPTFQLDPDDMFIHNVEVKGNEPG